MEVPRTNYCGIDSRWSDRIKRENRVNSLPRSSGYECRSEPNTLTQKITTIRAPRERHNSIMEFMLLKEAAESKRLEYLQHVLSPRNRFLIPQVCRSFCLGFLSSHLPKMLGGP